MMKKKRELRIEKREARAARRGFAFTEVLFAVMVLGIGFIMIAAMFPVTIRQTQNSMQDTHGANTAKGALAYLQSIASNVNFPVTVTGTGAPKMVSLYDAPLAASTTALRPGYLEARGNFIDPNNPRIAWVPLYRRGLNVDGTPEPYAQVIIIVMQSRIRPQYTSIPQPLAGNKYWSDQTPEPTFNFPRPTIDAKPTTVTVKYNPATLGGEITFAGFTGATQLTAPTAPGAYVVISDDQSAGALQGHSNGRIYQLGNVIDETNQIWALAPGSDMVVHTPAAASDDNDITVATSQAYIIGRGYTDMTQKFDASNLATGYSGAAQDIAVYTGFIQISR
jgi:hypothetical protein